MIDATAHLGLVGAVVHRRQFPPIDEEEAFAIGSLALVRAAQSYDPARGSFANHALPRIKYALLDEQRHLIGRYKRHPPVDSLEAHCERHPAFDVRGADLVLPAPRRDDIEHLIAGLPERWQDVLRWYYVDGLRQRVIAERLGVTEKRVSQLRLKALQRLRSLPQFTRETRQAA